MLLNICFCAFYAFYGYCTFLFLVFTIFMELSKCFYTEVHSYVHCKFINPG
jgi:hypothetical protein